MIAPIGELAGGVRISGFDGDPASLPIHWINDEGERVVRFSEIELNLEFEPHPGWVGQIERPPGLPLRDAG